jgi:lycopene cyclase domain-containing protein
MTINYLLLDILIILFPFLLSFKWKFAYYRYFKALFPSIAIVGLGYIIWDAIVTARGDWAFNYDYLSGVSIVGLPVEEILFFIVVPYSCIFIYENLEFFLPDKKIPFNRYFYIMIIIIFFVGGLVFYYQDYTLLALMSCGFFFLVVLILKPELLQSRNYWLYIGISMIPFIIFNYLLTSIPIVTYNQTAIWGGDGLWNGRFFTIPLEDFFYNYSMLSLYLTVYLAFKKRWLLIKKDNIQS